MRLGELDAKTNNICSTSGNILCTESQDFEIENMVHHPSYDNPKYSNDIALIRLRRKSNSSKFSVNSHIFAGYYNKNKHFLDFVSPLCLPLGQFAETDTDLAGKNGIIAGWGAMSAGNTLGSLCLLYSDPY